MSTDQLSVTFAALADPTRRAILAHLSKGEASVTELAKPFQMSLPAISKHLKVLERARLITRGAGGSMAALPSQSRITQGRGLIGLSPIDNFGRRGSIGWMITCTNYKPRSNKMTHTNDAADTQSDRAIVITRIFNAPLELVYQVWTQPEHITQWWGPKGFTTRVEALDLSPGGQWRYVMIGPDGTEVSSQRCFPRSCAA